MKKMLAIVAFCMPLAAFFSCGDDDSVGSFDSGEEYVDLGLSVKWATKNLGASSCVDYGDYYAWAETVPYEQKDSTNLNNRHYNYLKNLAEEEKYGEKFKNYNINDSTVKRYYWWDTYKYCDSIVPIPDGGGANTIYLSKYNYLKENGPVDGIMTLSSSDDAVVVNLGGNWRTPTHKEAQELVNNCYWCYTSSYKGSGVAGYIVYKVKSADDMGLVTNVSGVTNYGEKSSPVATEVTGKYSLSDTHIFLPMAGYHHKEWLYNENTAGSYWTKTLNDETPKGAFVLYLWENSRYSSQNMLRQYGCTIRPVQ